MRITFSKLTPLALFAGAISLIPSVANAESARRPGPTMAVATDRTSPAYRPPTDANVLVEEEEIEEEPELRQLHKGLELGYLGLAVTAQRYSFDDYELDSSEDIPDVLKAANPRLRGKGWGYGGLFRFGYQSDAGFRFGLGMGAAVLDGDGVGVVHNGLPTGVTIEHSQLLMVNFQATFGKAFDLTHLYPYADLKVSANLVATDIKLSVPEYGLVGTTSYTVFTMSVAPRVGVLIPLDENVFIDGSVEYGLFGAERFGGQVHIGLMFD